jgi:hypothetical protein
VHDLGLDAATAFPSASWEAFPDVPTLSRHPVDIMDADRNHLDPQSKVLQMIALHHDGRVVDVFTDGQHGDEELMSLTRELSPQA